MNCNRSMTNNPSSPSLMTRLIQITQGSHYHHHQNHHPQQQQPALESIGGLEVIVSTESPSGHHQSNDLMISRDEDAVIDSCSSPSTLGHTSPGQPSSSLSPSSSQARLSLEPNQGSSKSPRKVPSTCLNDQLMAKTTGSDSSRKSPVVIAIGSNDSFESGPGSSCSSSKNVVGAKEKPKQIKSDGVSNVPSRRSRRKSEWEILEGLKEGQTHEQVPDKFEGWMLKRRKWPLKGWHKRWFVIENGVLSYTKNPGDIVRGKIHGSVDVGLSVISTKLSSKRIDIDAEEFIYHIKCKNKSAFANWVSQLRVHRLYRQHQIAFGSKVNPNGTNTSGSPTSVVGYCNIGSPTANDHKVASWILNSSHVSFDSMYKELNEYQVKLVELCSILQMIESQAGSRAELLDEKETRSAKKGGRRRFLPLGRHKKQASVTVPTSSSSGTNFHAPVVMVQQKGKGGSNKGGNVDTELGSSSFGTGSNSNQLGVMPHDNVMPHVRSESAISFHDSSDQESVPSSCASFTVGQTGHHFTFSGDHSSSHQPQPYDTTSGLGGSSTGAMSSSHSQSIVNQRITTGTRPRYQFSLDQASSSKTPSKVAASSSSKPYEDFISTATESKFVREKEGESERERKREREREVGVTLTYTLCDCINYFVCLCLNGLRGNVHSLLLPLLSLSLSVFLLSEESFVFDLKERNPSIFR